MGFLIEACTTAIGNAMTGWEWGGDADEGILARTRNAVSNCASAIVGACRRPRRHTGPERHPARAEAPPHKTVAEAKRAYYTITAFNILVQAASITTASFSLLDRNPADYDPDGTPPTPLGPSLAALGVVFTATTVVLTAVKVWASPETQAKVDIAVTAAGQALATAAGAQNMGLNLASLTVGKHPYAVPIATSAGLVVGVLGAVTAPSGQRLMLPVAEALAKRDLMIARGATEREIVTFESQSVLRNLAQTGILCKKVNPYADISQFGFSTLLKSMFLETTRVINAFNSGQGIDTVSSILLNRTPSMAEKGLAGSLAALFVASGMWSVHVREGMVVPPTGCSNFWLRALEASGDMAASFPSGMYPVVILAAGGAYLRHPGAISFAAIDARIAGGAAPDAGSIATLAVAGGVGLVTAAGTAYLHQWVAGQGFGVKNTGSAARAHQALGIARRERLDAAIESATGAGRGRGQQARLGRTLAGAGSPPSAVINPMAGLAVYRGQVTGHARKPTIARTAHSGLGGILPGTSGTGIELPNVGARAPAAAPAPGGNTVV